MSSSNQALPSASQGRRRRAGSLSGKKRNKSSGTAQLPWSLPQNADQKVEPLPVEGVEAIHDAAMKRLEQIGIEFLNLDAVEILKKAGCSVSNETNDGALVKFDRALVMEKIALAPDSFSITPRNSEREVIIGGKNVAFTAIASPPNCSDMDRGRRPGDQESHRELVKLAQYFNCIHMFGGYPVEPVDTHSSVRHLECLRDQLTLSDKVIHAYSLGSERVDDAMEMVRIAAGVSASEFALKPRMFTNINSTSPLKHDWSMLDGLMRLSRNGQPTFVTPFTLAGAMSPITLAGTVAQSVAESLCAIALIQCINPGCPCGIGTFSSNVDMRSGAPAFGTPEYMRATQMTGQMARFYKLPLRSSNTCVSNAPDAQSIWESSNSLNAAMSSGTNLVYHAAGWLEGGLCASYEKFVMDCEMLQHLIAYMKSVAWDDDDLALDAIAEVGHGGHFFGIQHTQDRYENAFYMPFLSDWFNFENWRVRGSIDAVTRANGVWKKILEDYEPPAMDEPVSEELNAFVDRQIAEGGVPTDY